jgi:hypothetical protein
MPETLVYLVLPKIIIFILFFIFLSSSAAGVGCGRQAAAENTQ